MRFNRWKLFYAWGIVLTSLAAAQEPAAPADSGVGIGNAKPAVVGTAVVAPGIVGPGSDAPGSANAQPRPQLKLRPEDEIRNFEGPEQEEYILGPGDEISIDSAGHPELSGKHTLGPDGKITLPFAGTIKLSDQTREQAAESIAKAFEPLYNQVTVIVGVDKYASNRVTVLGRVTKPGIVTFDRTPSLLEAISQSGGLSGAGGTTESIPNRCAIYRGKDEVIWIDLRQMLNSGAASADVRLRRGDVVYVPSEQEEYVSVLGQVLHPGAFKLTPGLSVRDLFALAGGLTDDASKTHIRLIHPDTGMEQQITMADLLSSSKTIDFRLAKGDVIYVDKSGFAKIGFVLQKLSPATSLFMMGTAIR